MTTWQRYLDGLDPGARQEVEAWYESRPPAIQDLCRRFPPGSALTIDGVTTYVISYIESDSESGPGFMLSHVNPAEDFARAFESRFFVHLECIPTFWVAGVKKK